MISTSVSLSLFVGIALILDPGVLANKFCYSDPTCGPDSTAWPLMCHLGTSQSPINIDTNAASHSGRTALLTLTSFGAKKFEMQNNGHSLALRFNPCQSEVSSEGCQHSSFFPGLLDQAYTFSGAHFHWGKKDSEGSEHTINHESFGMEAHFVHYKSSFESLEDAVSSGEPDALAVVGVLFNASRTAKPNQSLAPIVRNLNLVQKPTEEFVQIEEQLDFTEFFRGRRLFSYEGSLTTPNCNQQVQWFVYKLPVTVASRDLEAFRTSLQGEGGEVLYENWRPVQALSSRKIMKVFIE